MKKNLLNSSAVLVSLAILNAIYTSLFAIDPTFIVRSTGVSYTLGLGSIGLFFIGMAYPKKTLVPKDQEFTEV